MTTPMTPDERFRALKALGVPASKAAWVLDEGATSGKSAGYVQVIGEPLPFPIRLTLPWSALVSENRRFAARGSRIFMTKVYRDARARVKPIAVAAMTAGDGALFGPLARPLALAARIYFPDHRVHDAPNFAGATHNALKGIVFADDVWLYRVTWERAGVDVDAPRAEIEITPL